QDHRQHNEGVGDRLAALELADEVSERNSDKKRDDGSDGGSFNGDDERLHTNHGGKKVGRRSADG
ncbi:MAG: hypothetical protein IJP42_01505, partial [Selenomonadaceae bacterium]|nr:hypothetical protein [Selenomonadaceae bacterium]